MSQGDVEHRTGLLRCVAGAYLATEKHFRRIQSYQDLWALAAALGRANKSVTPQEKRWRKLSTARRLHLQLNA